MATTETNPFQPLRRWSLFRRVAWRRRDAIGGIVISLLVAGLGFLTTLGGFLGSSFAWFIALSLVLQVGVLLAFPLWLVRRRGYAPNPRPWTAGFVAKELLIAVPLAVGVLISAGLVASLARAILIALRRPAQSPLDFWGRLSMREAIAISIMAVALAPLAEEIFFRGYIYNSLRRICPMWIALAAQACFFGLGHFYQPLGVVTTFAIGLLLAAIYEWRKTLLANVLVHGMYNSVSAMVIIATVANNLNAPAIGIMCSREGQDQVLVERVLPGSPAEKADLRAGDVILQYNGSDVADYDQLLRLIHAGKVGDTATLEILRDGTRMTKRLALSSRGDWN